MADDAGYDAFDGDTLLPKNPFDYGKTKTKTLEEVSGQPTGSTTGIKSVKPLQEVKPTPAPGLWGGGLLTAMGDVSGTVNNDAPTLGALVGKTKDQITSGLNKAYPEVFDPNTNKDPAIDPKWGPEGGEAAPLGITSPALPAGTARKPLEKFADVLDTKNPPTEAPQGSLAAHITEGPPDPNIPPPEAFPPTQDLSAKAAPTEQHGQPQQQRPGLFGLPGLLGEFGANVHNWTDQRRMQLMALAGGLAGAPSLGQGFGRGFTAAAGAMPQQQELNAQNATIDYFKKSGMDQSTAMAFAGNKALAQEALGQMTGMAPPKTMQWKDWLGGQHQLQWDWKNKTWKNLDTEDGNSGGSGGSGGSIGAGIPGGLTRPVSQEEWQSLSVPQRIELIKDPATRGLVQSLSVGGNIPGRQQMTAANSIMAQIDPNWNQVTSYQAEKDMAAGLNKNNVTQHGGAMLRIMSTFAHMHDAAHASAEVGGWSGYNGPGGGRAGNAYMGIRNFSGDPRLQSSLREEAKQWNNASTESTAYYAGAPGSEGERTAGLRDVDTHATPMEKAGTLRGQAKQLDDKFKIHLAQVLGTNYGKQYFKDRPYLMEEFQRNRNGLDIELARLDPTGPEAQKLRASGQLPQTQTPPQTQGTEGTGGKPPVVFQGGHEFHLQPDGNYHYWRSQ